MALHKCKTDINVPEDKKQKVLKYLESMGGVAVTQLGDKFQIETDAGVDIDYVYRCAWAIIAGEEISKDVQKEAEIADVAKKDVEKKVQKEKRDLFSRKKRKDLEKVVEEKSKAKEIKQLEEKKKAEEAAVIEKKKALKVAADEVAAKKAAASAKK